MTITKEASKNGSVSASYAKDFLVTKGFGEENPNGVVCSVPPYVKDEIYVQAEDYYKENNLDAFFTLEVFKGAIRLALETSVRATAEELGLKRTGRNGAISPSAPVGHQPSGLNCAENGTNASMEKSYSRCADLIQESAFECIRRSNAEHIAGIIEPFEKQKHDWLVRAFNNGENTTLLMQAKQELLEFIEETASKRDDFEIIGRLLNFQEPVEKSATDAFEVCFDKVRYSLLLRAFVNCFLAQKVWRLEEHEIHSLSDAKRFGLGKRRCYRGQSNGNWRLVPSALRGEKSNCRYDLEAYRQRTQSRGLKDKYERLISQGSDKDAYSFCAFLQHYRSFSPFIDFSKSDIVATSFSLKGGSSAGETDAVPSAVFVCCFDEEKPGVKILGQGLEVDGETVGKTNEGALEEINDFLENEFFIYNIDKERLCFGEEICVDGSDKPIVLDSLAATIDSLMPRICFIDFPTNDRMKYQQGMFLCFYGCINLGGRIFYELSPFFKMIKLTIKPEDKKDIMSSIEKDYPEYDERHILDPYLIFNE